MPLIFCEDKERTAEVKKRGAVLTVLRDLIMAVVINTAAAVLAGKCSASGFLLGVAEALSINVAAGALIPVESIGNRFAGVFHAAEGTALHKLLSVFAVNWIYVTIISFCMTLLQSGLTVGMVALWLNTYLPFLAVGYLTSLLIETPTQKFTANLFANH